MTTLLTETFDDADLDDRGWIDEYYDVWLDTTTKYSGASSWRITFNPTATNCRNTANDSTLVSIRRAFTSSDQIYVSFYWRFNSDWVGSGQSYHPHLFFILHTVWGNLSVGLLRIYVEVTGTTLRFITGLGDDVSDPGTVTFHDTSYEFPLGEWKHVECWFKNNTVGQSNGEMKSWVNGISVLDLSNIVYRTSSSIHFAAVAMAPWISDGSPQSQTMWMDELIIGTEYLSRGKGDLLSMPSSRLCNKTNVRRLHPKI